MERLPFQDPRAEYIGVGKLRVLTGPEIEKLKHPIFLTLLGRKHPVGVILSHEQYAAIQEWYTDEMLAKVGLK